MILKPNAILLLVPCLTLVTLVTLVSSFLYNFASGRRMVSALTDFIWGSEVGRTAALDSCTWASWSSTRLRDVTRQDVNSRLSGSGVQAVHCVHCLRNVARTQRHSAWYVSVWNFHANFHTIFLKECFRIAILHRIAVFTHLMNSLNFINNSSISWFGRLRLPF